MMCGGVDVGVDLGGINKLVGLASSLVEPRVSANEAQQRAVSATI